MKSEAFKRWHRNQCTVCGVDLKTGCGHGSDERTLALAMPGDIRNLDDRNHDVEVFGHDCRWHRATRLTAASVCEFTKHDVTLTLSRQLTSAPSGVWHSDAAVTGLKSHAALQTDEIDRLRASLHEEVDGRRMLEAQLAMARADAEALRAQIRMLMSPAWVGVDLAAQADGVKPAFRGIAAEAHGRDALVIGSNT